MDNKYEGDMRGSEVESIMLDVGWELGATFPQGPWPKSTTSRIGEPMGS